jgi:YfiH family protein
MTAAAFIEPQWPAPPSVLAMCTTRIGGASAIPYDGFNLALHVGDDPGVVAGNRQLLLRRLPADSRIQWLDQVHSADVVAASDDASCPAADASFSCEPGMACAVLTADCLPVLFTSVQGDCVAAAHAGWRGLQAGVLENTVAAMDVAPNQLLAWLGPAIGRAAFEVGPEVRQAFMDAAGATETHSVDACFIPSASRASHFHADLYRLAGLRLRSLGVSRIFGGNYCTFSEANRFYSYRRDGQCGRMASLILLR